MRAGSLRHRVSILHASEGRGTMGDVTSQWQAIGTCWASVEPLSGRELMLAQQIQAEATIRVRMRYRSDVTHQSRILHNQRTLDVVQVINPAERNEELELLCMEVL